MVIGFGVNVTVIFNFLKKTLTDETTLKDQVCYCSYLLLYKLMETLKSSIFTYCVSYIAFILIIHVKTIAFFDKNNLVV